MPIAATLHMAFQSPKSYGFLDIRQTPSYKFGADVFICSLSYVLRPAAVQLKPERRVTLCKVSRADLLKFLNLEQLCLE